LSKPKVGKPRAQKSGTDGVKDSPFRSRIVHLNSIPIADPWREKKMFEKGEFARKLNPDYAGAIIAQDEDTNRIRIIEANRQCFESAHSTGSRLKVVRDFAAHFPDLLFDAYWIKELVRRESVENRFSKAQKEVLDAILTGLRSAVKSQPGKSAVRKYFDIAGAQAAKENIQNELSKWNEDFQRDLAHPPEWVAERAAEKADVLIQTYGIQGPRAQQRLTELLKQGHCYKAAVLITSEVFNVSERDLESKLE
jgi:hypothetical protein